jgi:hypothetical protein
VAAPARQATLEVEGFDMLALARAVSRRKASAGLAIGLTFAVVGTTLAGTGIGGVFNLGRTNAVNYVTTLTGAYASRLLQITNTSTSAAAVGAQIRASYGTPLQLIGSLTKPPLTVNSSVRVPRLNVERAGLADNASALGGQAPSAYQKAVTGTCAVGSTIRAINSDGTVVCDPDDGTTYTASHPITISGGAIGLSGDRCETGNVYKYGTLREEAWACAPDAVDGGNATTLDGVDSTGFLSATGKAADADKLDGKDSTAFASSSIEAWREVGTAGQPPFENCKTDGTKWTHYGSGVNNVAFYKDPFGRVHLKGSFRCSTGNWDLGGFSVFYLPSGYRPAANTYFTIPSQAATSNAPNLIVISSDGRVGVGYFTGGTEYFFGVDSISFRAAP